MEKRPILEFVFQNNSTSWEIDEEFEINQKSGKYANGTYHPLEGQLVVQEISHKIIEITLEDLLQTGQFEKYFESEKNV